MRVAITSARALIALAMLLAVHACDDRTPEQAATSDPVAQRQAMIAIESALASSRVDDALLIARRLVEVAPESASAHELLGRALIARSIGEGDPLKATALAQEAWSAYRQAVSIGDPAAGLLNAAGVTAQSAGDPGAAIRLFERAAEKEPSNPQHPLFAGLALHRVGRDDEARRALDRAALLAPDSPWPVAGLSSIALAAGDSEEALALARRARAIDPTTDELRVVEAKALRRLGRSADVLTLLLALPEASRFTDAVTFEIAAAYLALGDRPAAARARALFAEHTTTAKSALEAAAAWDEAGDGVQAESWRRVAAERR